MIKKLQALKAKKGFTLVELVVVIAIIGVLAAILIPVMIGVVQDANITSADSLAKQIYTFTTTFVQRADNNKQSLRGADKDNVVYVQATISSGTWTFASTTSHKTITGGAAATGTNVDSGTAIGDLRFGDGSSFTFNGTDTEKNLAGHLGDNLRELTSGVVYLYFQNGACVGAIVEQGGTTDDMAGASGADGLADDVAEVLFQSTTRAVSTWDGKAGVLAGGIIIGTYPKIALS